MIAKAVAEELIRELPPEFEQYDVVHPKSNLFGDQYDYSRVEVRDKDTSFGIITIVAVTISDTIVVDDYRTGGSVSFEWADPDLFEKIRAHMASIL